MLKKIIRIPNSNPHDIMNQLGQIDNAIEFIDMTHDLIETKKPYFSMISRCDSIDKIFVNFEVFCEEHNVPLVSYENYSVFLKDLLADVSARDKVSGSTYFDLIEAEVMEDERKLTELAKLYQDGKEEFQKLFEEKLVLERLTVLFETGEIPQNQEYMVDETGQVSDLTYMAGVCRAEDEIRLKRSIFRVSRGRAISAFFNFPLEGVPKQVASLHSKKFFLVVIQAGIQGVLLRKVENIFKIFNANIYPITRPDKMQANLQNIVVELSNKMSLLVEGEKSIVEFIHKRAGEVTEKGEEKSIYSLYRLFFKQEKMIYTNLNRCLQMTTFIEGEVWIPENKFDQIVEKIQNLAQGKTDMLIAEFYDPHETSQVYHKGHNHNKENTPPTFFRSNDFIYPFQEIVNTYGIPKYQEANPALFTIVTFPFLFGVMFGDIGHGSLLILFSCYLIREKESISKLKSPLKSLIKSRYLFLLMGIFSFFAGWMYNDFISIPLNLFGSCYVTNPESPGQAMRENSNCVYPLGLDPKWYVASNELAFFNSLKMKLAVIIGVIQMIGGIILRGINCVYFKNLIDFWFEFVPQIIFMTLLFGYMIIMIFIKWATDWSNDPSMAPSIITLLMNMFLNGGSVGGKPLWGQAQAEEMINSGFLKICILCLPILLLPKPILLSLKAQKKEDQIQTSHKNSEIVNDREGEQSSVLVPLLDQEKEKEKEVQTNSEHHEESVADIFVQQSIETIEFTLGSISNTASYLRLWALSLAHAQLSKVFFERALLASVQQGSLLFVIIGYFIFANVTIGVLMFMDLLECFLHTLRLHWVEFQNKFFKAEGRKYSPFSFKYLVEAE